MVGSRQLCDKKVISCHVERGTVSLFDLIYEEIYMAMVVDNHFTELVDYTCGLGYKNYILFDQLVRLYLLCYTEFVNFTLPVCLYNSCIQF